MRRLFRLLLTALPLWATACAGGHQATEKQLDELRSDLAKLRADHAAVAERLDALEIQRGGLKGYAPAPAAGDKPELDVVKLGPDAPDDGTDDPDAEGARPVLRSTGSG